MVDHPGHKDHYSVIGPFYNGTKARIHFWSMNLRTQLKDNKERVVEIAPPTGSTGLRRERANVDDNKREKNSSALSVDEFKDSITKDRKAGKEVIGAGPRQKVKDRWFERVRLLDGFFPIVAGASKVNMYIVMERGHFR